MNVETVQLGGPPLAVGQGIGRRPRQAAGTIETCVVGAGPRGISAVERLCANASLLDPARQRVVVHVVDPLVEEGGRVWTTAQSRGLLMNTIASQVTMFTDDSVECEGPVVRGPSLYEWARFVAVDPAGEHDPDVREEAAALGPDTYPSRALYGHYLRWVLGRLVRVCPAHVSVRTHARVAVALEQSENGSQVLVLDDGTRLAGLDAVVLAQGHIAMPLTEEQRKLSDFAVTHGLCYLPPSNPSDADLSKLRPGDAVALRGLGLNFFDYMVLLTQERGGAFVRHDGRLVYRPSGREPVLYAGSRRGVPYHARGENQKGAFGRHDPMFLTLEKVRALRDRRRRGRPIGFVRDVWPLIACEVKTVYYSTLVAESHGAARAEEFGRYYTRAVLAGDTAEDAVLDWFGIGRRQRWNWDWIARPYGRRGFTSTGEFERWLLGHLRADLREAQRGNVHSPLKAALDVLRDLRNEVRLVVDHSGVTGSSYRDELQGWYTPLNAYLSVGPPARRIEEMIALIEAGVLHMVGPRMKVDPVPAGTGFLVRSESIPDEPVRVRALVEARLPDVDIRRTTDPLVRDLLERRECRPYLIPDGPTHYETGGLAVTERPYHLMDATGRPHPRRFAFGVPTEAVHWVTAAGIRPGVNSVILGDADAIARSCLAAGKPGGAHRRIRGGYSNSVADRRDLSCVR